MCLAAVVLRCLLFLPSLFFLLGKSYSCSQVRGPKTATLVIKIRWNLLGTAEQLLF